ncbi:hypothetical protein pneo_cds_1054 [Pandoravirus neocaledonia]|uniref:F-box incomplete domain containing protein n=1 Tax=Pandoravirus neocaledonia TaxID=2107708 RepID=A0A2U7UDX4_9VIRU|nr:hypothetical protein pneo_cds_1054 [Pandoravirus neocaledonia]AVK76661.1 hypothetical protein pneo_cds_1054 [Pandoravirus neocaledonia]
MRATDDDAVEGHGPSALLDLPPEVRAEITKHIRRPADVVACARASAALLTNPIDREITDRLPRPIDTAKLLENGPPPSVLADLASKDLISLSWSMLPDVVAGGRVDSLRWVCHRLVQEPRPLCRKDGACHYTYIEPLIETYKGWDRLPCLLCQSVLDAVNSAAAMHRFDMLRCLLDEHSVVGRESEWLFGDTIRRAAYIGNLALVAPWHERNTPTTSDGHCCCHPPIGLAALRGCQIDALDWLCDHNCNAVVLPSLASIGRVLIEGVGRDAERASVIGWLIDRLPPSEITTGGLRHMVRRVIRNDMGACRHAYTI